MSNAKYESNINRRYSTVNTNKRLQEFLGIYNNLLIEHKYNIDDAKKNNIFNENIKNIKNYINNLENILINMNTEIKEKNSYLEQSNNLLGYHKKFNKELKAKLKELENTNAGAIGMYIDIIEVYKYVLLEYILIILGIIVVIYYCKQ